MYDLNVASLPHQKKWKWMLAMLSHRFAVRLGQFMKTVTPLSRYQIRERQIKLFQSCSDLLEEIKSMGEESHDTLRATVLEQLSNISLER